MANQGKTIRQPFFCVKCMKEHDYVKPYPKTDADREARYAFQGHKQYAKGEDAATALEWLRAHIKPGDTVTTVTTRPHTSRKVRLLIALKDQIYDFTRIAARAGVGNLDDRHGALTYGGGGYSASFEAVYSLGRVLFAPGLICVGEGCPANDHANGDRNYEPHKHSDAGYALRQREL